MAALTYLKRVGIALSVLVNVVLGGPSNQTFSARNWGWRRDKKPNLVWLIDGVCAILQLIINRTFNKNVDFTYHCMTSWIYWRSRRDVQFEEEQKSNKS